MTAAASPGPEPRPVSDAAFFATEAGRSCADVTDFEGRIITLATVSPLSVARAASALGLSEAEAQHLMVALTAKGLLEVCIETHSSASERGATLNILESVLNGITAL